MNLTHGSLFAGIGGFDLGFERAGIKTVWQVEIDAYCRRVLEKHFPAARRFPDIRECCAIQDGGFCHRHSCTKLHLPAVDILSGGFPCQDISNAGKRAGIDGERSGLWSEYARIIRELRPRYVVVENVAALLSPFRKRGWLEFPAAVGRILGDLAACGYDAEWECLPANFVDCPQLERDRIFIVAYPNGDRCLRPQGIESPTHYEKRVVSSYREEWRTIGDSAFPGREDVSNIAMLQRQREFRREPNGILPRIFPESSEWWQQRKFAGRDGAWRFTSGHRWPAESEMDRMAYGVPARVDRLRGLGNAIIPQIAEWIGRRILVCDSLNSTHGKRSASDRASGAGGDREEARGGDDADPPQGQRQKTIAPSAER